MNPLDVIDIGRDALRTLVIISAPVMLTALVVGLVIALFQALTQIQEMTLTFVPKMLAIFFVMIITLPFMFQTLSDFNDRLIERIVSQENIADIPLDEKKPDTQPAAP